MVGENGRGLKLGIVIRIPCVIIDASEHEELLRWVWRPVWSVDERTDGSTSIIIAGTNRHVALRKRGRFYIHTAMLNSHLGDDDGLEAQVF